MAETNRPVPAGLQPGHAEPVKVARVGLYPGTFDPVTNGHLDVIARAARLLDKLIVGVAINTGKGPLFSVEERLELVKAEIAAIAGKNGMVIDVLPYDTLTIDFSGGLCRSLSNSILRASIFPVTRSTASAWELHAPDSSSVGRSLLAWRVW